MSQPKKLESARERVARNVKAWREQRGLSQQSLSAGAGITRPYLARVETGVQTVSVDNLEKLAKALSIDIVELLKPEP
jgi:transcriptional regulator with XRE-family HTH domain